MAVEKHLGPLLKISATLLLIRLDADPPPFSIPLSLQRRMSARMDSFSATTGGAYPPSGGATMTTTARTTVTRRTVVSLGPAPRVGCGGTSWGVQISQLTWCKTWNQVSISAIFLTGMCRKNLPPLRTFSGVLTTTPRSPDGAPDWSEPFE